MSFGSLLRRYRAHAGWSQERLAAEAEVSTRHLSCLETHKAEPSRSMVLVLGSALDLPLRDRNALLEAAGFTSAYRDEPLDSVGAAELRRAMDLVLAAMEPNGAVAVDHAWNILQQNGAATALLSTFVDVASAPREVLGNVVLAVLHPQGLRPAIVNFDEVAAFTVARARREAARLPHDPRGAAMLARLETIVDLPRLRAERMPAGPFVTVHLRRGGVEARIFSTVATLGSPIDAMAEEVSIETFFPADDATRRLFDSFRGHRA